MTGRPALLHYLERARAEVNRSVAGVDEYDARRPLTPSGSNLLGIVKHLATVEEEYLRCAGYDSGLAIAWSDEASLAANAELCLTPDQTSAQILDLYAAVAGHTARAVESLPPDAPATVPWWSEPATTFDRLLLHLVAETAQHAGHLAILREGIDGQGDRWDEDDPDRTPAWREDYVRRVEEAAAPFRGAGRRVRD